MNNSPQPLLTCRKLCKTYQSGGSKQTILNNVALTVQQGEVLAIVGASGSGKTTLLHLLGGLESPDNGEVLYNRTNIYHLPGGELSRWRNRQIAYIFQFHLLLPEFSALENVAMPLLLRRQHKPQALATAADCLAAVNLSEHQHKTPEKLSGGERQRVAVARALAGGASLILADEPTGNLDYENAEIVFTTLLKQCRQRNMALIIVSHDKQLTQRADRILTLHKGTLRENS